MDVFVAGGTGVVGRPAVGELVAAGHRVTAVARTAARARIVEDLGATPVEVDLFDPAAVATAVAGYGAVVNLATRIPPLRRAGRSGAWAENHRIRREVSRNLVDAALAGGVRRVLQESLAFFYEDRGDRWIDETTPVVPPPAGATLWDAEGQARRVTDAGGIGVVLRFGIFYGPSGTHTGESLRMARWHLSPALGRPGAHQAAIHTADAGAAVVAALGAPAGVYNVVDDEPLTKRDHGRAVARAAGVGRVVQVPSWLLALGGRDARAVGRSQRVSNRRFRQATGWAPRYPSARDGWEAVGRQLRGAGAPSPGSRPGAATVEHGSGGDGPGEAHEGVASRA